MTSNANQYTWAGRFSEPVSDLVKRYTASVDFDQRMWRQDIRGSLAHARMLARQGIIGAADLADIERGMAIVTEEIESGKFEWSIDLEDVHLNIEARLTQLVGDAMIAQALERDTARRCFEACERLERLWLELRDLREETHSMAWSPRQQLAIGGRLARLADACGQETRAACLGAPGPR